jgi:hypothetical protein
VAVDSMLASAIEWVPGETRHFLERGAWEDVRQLGGGDLSRVVTRIFRDHVRHTEPHRRCHAFRNGEVLER